MLGYSAIISLYLCVLKDTAHLEKENPVNQNEDTEEGENHNDTDLQGGFGDLSNQDDGYDTIGYSDIQLDAFEYLSNKFLPQDATRLALQFESYHQLWAFQYGVEISTALQFRSWNQYIALVVLGRENDLDTAVERALQIISEDDINSFTGAPEGSGPICLHASDAGINIISTVNCVGTGSDFLA